MYILAGARVRRDRRSGRWEATDLRDVAVATLRVTHGDVWLFITYPSQTEPQAVRFDDVSHWTVGTPVGVTVQEWLTSLGNRTLPFAEVTPSFTPTYVRYTQAWHSGYDIQSIPRLGHVDAGGSEFDKDDLLITRDDLDPIYLAEHAMVSVNGFFHLVDYNGDGVRVMGGNRSVRLANDNQIGIHSFTDIGRIQHVPITGDMLFGQSADARLLDGTYLKIPESVDITNKTILLVVGGYLQVLGKTYTQVSDRVYKVALGKLMLLERYYDSRDYMDLSSLGLERYDSNDSLLSTAAIQSDTVVRAYFALEQSFLVVVDTPQMFHELDVLEQSGLPGRYYDHAFDHLPVVGAYGRGLEYHGLEEDGITVIAGSNNIRHDYDYLHRKWFQHDAVDDGRYPHNPFTHTHAWVRRLGCEQ